MNQIWTNFPLIYPGEYRRKFCGQWPFPERCVHDLCKTLSECLDAELGAHFAESGAHFAESGAHFAESGVHFAESGVHFADEDEKRNDNFGYQKLTISSNEINESSSLL